MSFVMKRRKPHPAQDARHPPFSRRWAPAHDTPRVGFDVGSPHHPSERAADAIAAAAVDGSEVPLSIDPASPAVDGARPLSDFKLTDNDINAARDQGGAALPRQLQSGFEAVHGRSVGNIRVHDNPHAHELSRALNASAFSVGNDIFFNRGAYHPRSRAGRRLLAHELAHTTQARPGEQIIRRSSSKHPYGSVFFADDGSQKSHDEIAQVIITKLEENPEADGFVLGILGAPLGLGLPNEWQQRRGIALAFFKKASVQLLRTLRSSRDGSRSYTMLSSLIGAKELAEVERRHGLPPVPPKAPKVEGDPTYGPNNFYRLDDLSSNALTSEQAEFKEQVYKKAAKNGHANREEFVWGVPDADRGVIEGDVEAHKVVAGQARLLLEAVRGDWASAKAAGDPGAQSVTKIELTSTYRDADNQFRLWDSRFQGYWNDAQQSDDQKYHVEPGEMGSDEVKKLARYIGVATASPGYSQHQKGLAIDFAAPTRDTKNKKHSSEVDGVEVNWQRRWRETWLYQWLVDNAAVYGFEPYSGEAWHWNYVGPK